MAPNERFGDLLDEGIISVAKRQRKQVAAVEREIAEALGYSYHTVQRWRRGHLPKEPDQKAFLARYCVTQGRVDRPWAASLLTQAHYQDRGKLLQELFPEHPQRAEVPRIYQNLPPRYGGFLGREGDMARVLEGLASRWPLVSIEGLGGVGKTTLAIETARRCLSRPDIALELQFEAVVWVSAKDRLEQKRWLNDVLDAVARVLDYPYITQLETTEQKSVEVDQLLRSNRVLVIVDNFETIEDVGLVAWMKCIPEPSKVLITSRYVQLRSVWAIHLQGLEEPQALELIRRHSRRLGLSTLESSDVDTLLPLVRVTDGNPKAIEMAIGLVKSGILSLSELVDHLHAASQTVGDIFQDLFARAWRILSEDAQHVLLVMPFFVDAANKQALGAATRLEGYRLDTALGQLVEMALLEKSGESKEAPHRYGVHPLTGAFAGVKAREDGTFEYTVRERQALYYLEMAQQYGGDNWLGYPFLEAELENILSTTRWCYQTEQWVLLIELFVNLWRFLLRRGYWDEQTKLSRHAIEACHRSNSKAAMGLCLHSLAAPLFYHKEYGEAERLCFKAQEIFEETGNRHGIALTLEDFGQIACWRGDFQTARRFHEAYLSLSKDLGVEKMIARALWVLGDDAFEEGRLEEASQFYTESLQKKHELDDPDTGTVLFGLGKIAKVRGDLGQAREMFVEAEKVHGRGVGYRHEFAQLRYEQAGLEEREGNWTTALAYGREARDLFHRLAMCREEAEAANLIKSLKEALTRDGR